VSLTPTVFRLLAALVADPNRARTRFELMRTAFNRPVSAPTRAIDTHLKRLRRKIGPAGAYIRTLRGVGYRFAATPDERAPGATPRRNESGGSVRGR
jgi:two-component system phosphate regulon response regulator PhoB